MYQTFSLPTKVVSGIGCVASLADEIKRFGSSALVVSDLGIQKVGILDKVATLLKDSGVNFEVYTGVQPNPTVNNAHEAYEMAKRIDADVVVAVGGGSSIDTAKSVSVLLTNGGSLTDYVGFDKFKNMPKPVIAIPTTAGTGSEVTIVAVMNDTQAHRKFTVGSVRMMPKVAILDANFTLGLPAKVTAYTGMDALSHAIESLTSKQTQRVTDAINLDTIQSIFQFLPRAVFNGNDVQAREGMIYAACMASMTCNSTFLGLVHAIASPICAFYDIPHGMACAVLLPAVMKYNLPACEEKYARIADFIGSCSKDATRREKAESAVVAVAQMAFDIGIPKTFTTLGIGTDRLDEMAQIAANYPQAATNCRKATIEDVIQILKSLTA